MKIKQIKQITLSEPIQLYDVIEAAPHHNFIIKTNTGEVISHNCSFEDEVNFDARSTNVERQKARLKQIISQVDSRMASRFLRGDYLPTLNIIASSKASDQSFLDDYIETKRKNESETTLVIDEPQWVVDSRKQTGRWFKVAVGDKYLPNELIPEDVDEEVYREKGYNTILSVPSGYLEKFKDNLELALTDIAGISTASSTKYISGISWNSIKTDYENPFVKEIIEVGNSPDDHMQYANFFDLSKIPDNWKTRPMWIHLDMSSGGFGKGDKTGIAGVWIKGKRPSIEGEDITREMYYKVAFSVSVKAPKGFSISFAKHRNFIRWLRDQGFAIKGISCDTWGGPMMQQELKSDGFDVATVSVDRVDNKTHQQLPYAYFKTTMTDRRLEVYKKCPFLTKEALGLERLSDGHIEHPDAGKSGCFTGDTKVSLVDGRELTFLELVDEFNNGKANYVYSFNCQTKKIEPKLITKAWCTQKNAALIEVELDSGEVLQCTSSHKFMLRDGSYKEAKDLAENDSLMPLYRKYPTEVVTMKNYRMYYEPIEDKWHYEHRQFANEILDEKYLVHHKKNEESHMLKELVPTVDRIKFKEIFGFDYDSLPAKSKGAWCVKYRRIISKTILNHRVKAIRFIDKTADVYDITVQDNHNFALSAGIFVHNSKDQIDAVVGALWNAAQHSEEYIYFHGDNLDAALEVNAEISAATHKQQLVLDFQQELAKLYTDTIDELNRNDELLNRQAQEEYRNYKNILDGIFI